MMPQSIGAQVEKARRAFTGISKAQGDDWADRVETIALSAPDLLKKLDALRAELAAERNRADGLNESCERYIRDAHGWRDRAVRAEGYLTIIRDKLRGKAGELASEALQEE